MHNKYGSVWNKWDFHIHTPYSILNNQFGFNPFEPNTSEQFDEYVKILFSKAIENNIAAIGITDYFMIEGYKRIRQDYLGNPLKMEELFPEKDVRDQIKRIYIFPNIELRLNTYVGDGKHSVNYHVIFSDKLSVQEIEENFLHQLEFEPEAGKKSSLTKFNIESHGQFIKTHNGKKGSDLLVGLEHVTVNDSMILQTLKKYAPFEGKYLITISVDEDLSCVNWSGRDYSTRRNLYQQCDCYLTANKKTATWALAEGKEEARKAEFGSIKPCIWGSDAHGYDSMFHPVNDNFCWIKAEPSFDGLMQILYEPKERVVIQKNHPNLKDIHQIIESIQFDDDNFQTEPIVFNDNLTCIIGGKSTGKSLLIQQLAKTIDYELAYEQEKVSALKRKEFGVKNAIVKWKDGTSDTRKIVYIPQTFLNRTIDNPEETTAINKIIADVLQQEPDISTAFSNLNDDLCEIKKSTTDNIAKYCVKADQLNRLRETIKEEGNADSFEHTLQQLEASRAELAAKVHIQDHEIEQYNCLEKQLNELEKKYFGYQKEIENLESVNKPTVVIPGYFELINYSSVSHSFQNDFPDTQEELERIIKNLNETIQPIWEAACQGVLKSLRERLESIQVQIKVIREEFNELRTKVEQNEQLQTLAAHIAAERKKHAEALEREKVQKQLVTEIDLLRDEIVASQQRLLSAYEKYCHVVASVGTKKDTTLSFDAKPIWKQRDFQARIGALFDNRNFSSFSSLYHYNLTSLTEKEYDSKLLKEIWNAVDVSHTLTLKSGYTLKDALQQIFVDWYNIHYIVKSGNDTIDEMSPGKKALVLLELLISLEDSKCPILIDQPEDDLDNRSIYNDLVQYIKKKKKERQIIVVTHNANIVLGADAEEVIIANQNAKGTENMSKRFEYRSGAIENDEIGLDGDGKPLAGILNQHGIQTQICDILEGGHPAFELRKNKYMAIAQK